VFKIASIAAVALITLIIGTALAVPITYTVEVGALPDRPFGTFTYDAEVGDSGEYGNVSIWSSDY